MMRKRMSTFKPHLDQLEDRCCPSIVNPAVVYEATFSLKGVNHDDLFITTANGASTQSSAAK